MIRCTVLGGRGYLGRHLVQHLHTLGHAVWVPERDDPAIFTQPLGHVWYCIGLTADFRTRPLDTIDAHVGVLAQVLRRSSFQSLLYLSSTRVYAGATHSADASLQSTHEDAALQVQPHDPSHLYNLSKLAGESLCHHSGRAGVRVARLSNIVGPGMDADSGNFVASLLRDALAGHVLLHSDPASEKDYLHIHDATDWLTRIGLGGQAATYNVASGVQTTHAQWLHWLAQATGCTHAIAPHAPLQRLAPINAARLHREWGLAPQPVHAWLDDEVAAMRSTIMAPIVPITPMA